MCSQFKIAREAKKAALEDVAEELKIQTYYLEAIENFDFHLLPESVYAIGFIKSYANFLGIDYTQAVSRFKIDRGLQEETFIDEEKQPTVEESNIPAFFLNVNKNVDLLYMALYVVYIALIIAILAVTNLL